MKLQVLLGAGLAGAFVMACASAPPPTAKLASSEAAIRAAAELHADETPAAQLHLKLARDQMGQAKRLMANGDNERAEFVLLRAESDADVAVAIAKESQQRKQATDSIEQLRKARSAAPPMPSEPKNSNVPTPPVDTSIPPSVGR